MRILGIETSCDETAAAVVEDGRLMLSNVVASSVDLHKAYGGVVPEIAARSHLEVITSVIEEALRQAKYGQGTGSDKSQGAGEQRTEPYMKYGEGVAQPGTPRFTESTFGKAGFARLDESAPSDLWDDIDAIAVTYGPGLGGSLLIGTMTAKTLAIAKQKPLFPINHVEAHIYANFITSTGSGSTASEPSSEHLEPSLRDATSGASVLNRSSVSTASSTPRPPLASHQSPADVMKWILANQTYTLPPKPPALPLLALIVSGGHSHLIYLKSHSDYEVIGRTYDDAVGEAFDKVAKILGLPYPGGPSIEKAAATGNPAAIKLPKAKMAGKYDFSFSGLKTAVLRAAQAQAGKDFTFPSYELAVLLTPSQKADLAASFQHTALQTLIDNLALAINDYSPASVVIGGGVAANSILRQMVKEQIPTRVIYTDIKLCTDNAAMIAALGFFKSQNTQPVDPYTLEIDPNLTP